MALSLLHTCTISPLLTFDASSWLCIKLIYFSTQFLCLWSLQWYFLVEILPVSLAVRIFQQVPWDTAQKKLLALLFQIFQIFFQGFFSSFSFLWLSEADCCTLWEFAFTQWVKGDAVSKQRCINAASMHFTLKKMIAERPRQGLSLDLRALQGDFPPL